MLAPPPEGTFDSDDGSIPVKSTSKDSSQALKDSTSEQVPLLTQEGISIDDTAQKKDKVRLIGINMLLKGLLFPLFYLVAVKSEHSPLSH